MSIQSKFIEDKQHHDRQKAKLDTFWVLLAELLSPATLDLDFNSYSFYPDSNPPRLELTTCCKDEAWMETMRTAFAKDNTMFNPIESTGYSWDRTRIKSKGIIYEDTINCERPALEIILIGPPTTKCRTVKVIEHIEEQKYIEAHDEEVEMIVCGDNIPENAVLVEDE